MSHFRKADIQSQWYQDNFPGADMHLTAETMVVVLHDTEGATWPSYSDGSVAPNITGLPPIGMRFGKWRQHFPDEKSSRALVNEAGGVETNTLNAYQIELVGTCDPKHSVSWPGVGKAGKDYVYWPKATKRQKRFVARLLADLHIRHGLRLHAPAEFKPYPKSYGKDNGVRLSFHQWSNVTGVVGHQHVPENVHGDPGNIDVAFILAEARKIVRRRKRKK